MLVGLSLPYWLKLNRRCRDINLRDCSKIRVKCSKNVMKNPCQDNRPVDREMKHRPAGWERETAIDIRYIVSQDVDMEMASTRFMKINLVNTSR